MKKHCPKSKMKMCIRPSTVQNEIQQSSKSYEIKLRYSTMFLWQHTTPLGREQGEPNVKIQTQNIRNTAEFGIRDANMHILS